MKLILLTIFLFLTYKTIQYITVWLKANKENLTVKLKALKTHENRTLNFTKGQEYTFYKSGDHFILNSDDTSNHRDNYVFYKDDLDDHFTHTNLLSKLVLDNIVYLKY